MTGCSKRGRWVMVHGTRERETWTGGEGVTFACHVCGAVLRVPAGRSGVKGPCPCCGEWLVSPAVAGEREGGRGSGFASRRPPVQELVREPLPRVRPEGRIDRRVRRDRVDLWMSGLKRVQARLCVTALFLAALVVAFLHSQGWNLPWNVPEDSSVMRFLEGLARPESGGSLPTGPARRP